VPAAGVLWDLLQGSPARRLLHPARPFRLGHPKLNPSPYKLTEPTPLPLATSLCSTVAEWLWGAVGEGPAPEMSVPMKLAQGLRYGENPHQGAAFYTDASLAGGYGCVGGVLVGQVMAGAAWAVRHMWFGGCMAGASRRSMHVCWLPGVVQGELPPATAQRSTPRHAASHHRPSTLPSPTSHH